MLIAAAVCPHPPLLVPEMAGAAAAELDGLRAASFEAVRRLGLTLVVAGEPRRSEPPLDLVVVVGGDETTREYDPSKAYATLRPYGLDWFYSPGWGEEQPLPLSLSIGQWLLFKGTLGDARGMLATPERLQAVAEDATAEECLALGRELAGSAERVGLLVMGDGSACRSEKAPGYLDPRAEGFDATVAQALGNADAATLAALDPVVARELQAAGRAAWQVLAGAAGASTGVGCQNLFQADLLADQAPYGVGYFTASWLRSFQAG